MSMPLVNPWQLRPQVETLLDGLPWQRTIKSLLEKIALFAAQPPKAESGPGATAFAAAEPGAPAPMPIPEPGADVVPEIAPGVNMPTAEGHGSTNPTPLDLLDRIHKQLSDWDEVAKRIGVVKRSALLAWRDVQMGKDPCKSVKAATAQRIVDSVRRVAVELKILPS
jgi:hypothetical protein